MNLPRVSIVTAVFNNVATIESTIQSVLSQTYPSIEYVVVDGMSTDGTDQVIQKYADRIDRIVREKDDGIYDALNKGIANASGDIVGFLHADDVLAHPEVIQKVVDCFASQGVQAVYGDLVYVRPDSLDSVVRYWRSGAYNVNRFLWGWMPPHPTVYVKKECYKAWGGFRLDMDISADYEILLRMMVAHRISVGYVGDILVKMRVGGKSNASIENRLRANFQDRNAWIVNGLSPPIGLRFTKPLRKLNQFWQRPGLTSMSANQS